METKKDVDLYAELKKTLESEEVETPEASLEKPKEEVITPKEDDNEAELSEEEISKLSPRAQKRIRGLAEEVKKLAESKAEPEKETPKETPKEETKPTHEFKNVQEFLSAVQDKPSRELLEKFYGVIKSETSTILAPIEQKNNEAKFDLEFGKYKGIEGLSDYENDLKKTFLRNPNQSLKALVGEIVADISLNKIKPIEKTASTPNRGTISTEGKSKDELYDMLESMKE